MILSESQQQCICFNESRFSRKVAKKENNNIVVASPGMAIHVKNNNKSSGDFLGCSFYR